MTLQERLRVQYNLTAMEEFEQAADALDAKDARIKELEGALRDMSKNVTWIQNWLGEKPMPEIVKRLDRVQSSARDALK